MNRYKEKYEDAEKDTSNESTSGELYFFIIVV